MLWDMTRYDGWLPIPIFVIHGARNAQLVKLYLILMQQI